MRLKQKCSFAALAGVLTISRLFTNAAITLAQGDTWTEKAPMPTARLALAASVVDGKIYAIGGRAEGSLTTEYDPATDTWTTKAPMPTARFGLATAVVDGKIYAIGGTQGLGSIVRAVEAYDPSTDTWTKKTDMPTAKPFSSASALDGKIYVIGGSAPAPWSAHYRTVEVYDPVTDTWTTKADMHAARAYLSTSVVDGKIYAIGGALETQMMLSIVDVYHPLTDTWTLKTPMPTARFGHATAVVDGKIYAIGGGTHTPSRGFSVVEVYDPATDTWTTKADMPAKRCWHATGVVDRKIYAFGGSAAGYDLHPPGFRTVYEYTPPVVTNVEDPSGETNNPTEFVLHQNHPNPFNPGTKISYELPHSDRVVLKVFTMLGQEVRTLVDEFKPIGSFEVLWDGRDSAGQRMPSGVYLYRIKGKGLVLTRKMVLLQ